MSLCKVLAVGELAAPAAKRSRVEVESDDDQLIEIKLTMRISKQTLTKMFTKLGGFFGGFLDFSKKADSNLIDFSRSKDLTPAFMQQLVTAYKEEKNEFDFNGFFTKVKDAFDKWESIDFFQSDLLIHARNHYLCMNTKKSDFKDVENNLIYQELATWATDKLIKLLYLQDKKVLPLSLKEDPICLYKLHHSPVTWKLYKTLEEQDYVFSCAFIPDGTGIVLGTKSNMTIWNVEAGEVLKTLVEDDIEENMVVAIGPNRNHLVCGGFDDNDKSLHVWDMKAYRRVNSLEHPDVLSIAISPDEKCFVSSSVDSIKLWDINTGECKKTLEVESYVRTAISSDCKYIVSGSETGHLKVWDMDTGQCLKTLEHKDITSIAISLDGKYIVSGSDPGYIKLWDMDTGQCLKTLKGYKGYKRDELESVAISADGKYIFSGHFRKIRVWDIKSGQLLQTLEIEEQNSVSSFAFSPDGKYIVSKLLYDKSIKIWRAELVDSL